ncbi:hypothetical protein C0J52_06138 [Blattella germanica]|nr:hypothetical protein C0J52_06138 [Blattella germanica]
MTNSVMEVFVPPLPVGLRELRARIIHAFEQINYMLLRVWDELDYRIDIFRVTRKYAIYKIAKTFRETGSVLNKKPERKRRVKIIIHPEFYRPKLLFGVPRYTRSMCSKVQEGARSTKNGVTDL